MENLKLHIRSKWFARLSVFLLLAFITLSLRAQSPVNLSGTWIQDNIKSDPACRGFDVTMTITQTDKVIDVKQVFYSKNNKESTTGQYSIIPDGKEVTKEQDGGIDKESAAWSPDKKILTTKSTRTVGKDVYGSITTYSLESNGQVLKIKTADINPAGSTMTQYFNRNK
jgi:hypothetical protein